MAIAAAGAVLGLVLLTLAADHLVLGAARVAARLRVAPIVVGVVVIGLGTSAPEFLVSGLAAGQGHARVAVGNLVGSNILNLTLILGICALVRPVTVASTVLRREAPLSLAATAAFAVLVTIHLGLVTGLVLAACAVAAVLLLIRLARTTPDPAMGPEVAEFLGGCPPDPPRAGPPARPPIGREAARTAAGLAGVLAGAQLLVSGATRLATGLGVPPLVIGFTVVAVGTSLPELVTGVQAQRRGETDLLVGNLLGSNLFNSLAGGAVIGLASGATGVTTTWPLPAVMVLVAMLAWALLFRGARISRAEGLLLVAAYAATLPLLA
jgi:cation:H+ antiporter